MLRDRDLKIGTYFALSAYKKHKPHHYHHVHVITSIIDGVITCNHICTKNNGIMLPKFHSVQSAAFHSKDSMLHPLSEKETYDLNKWLVFQ